jgi:putative sigma-54 modulation protein
MKVNVTFRHMEADDQLRAYVDEKTQKLATKYFHRPLEATVVLTTEKFRKAAEISIKGDNLVLIGKDETEDMHSAIDAALDKLEIQGRKHREKYKPRKGGAAEAEPAGFAVFRGANLGEEFEARIIKEERFVPKPMTVEDAAMLFEDGRDDFLVFRNAENMRVCVIFRRPDGHLGLIEPEEK